MSWKLSVARNVEDVNCFGCDKRGSWRRETLAGPRVLPRGWSYYVKPRRGGGNEQHPICSDVCRDKLALFAST